MTDSELLTAAIGVATCLDVDGKPAFADVVRRLVERVEKLERERDVLNGTTCAEEMADGNGPCGICSTCWRARVEVAESKLRCSKCGHDLTSCHNCYRQAVHKWMNSIDSTGDEHG